MSLFNIINRQIVMDRIKALDNINKTNEVLLSDGKKYAGFYNIFVSKLLHKYYVERKDKNIVLSPFSILMLLTIAAESTSGIAQEEIVNELSDCKDFKEISGLFLRINKSMSSAGLNNAVCINREIKETVLREYWQIMKYHANILFVDKNEEELIAWIKERTNETCKKPPCAGTTADNVGFINISAFRANWDKPFEEKDIKIEQFEITDCESVATPMLHGNGNFYIENEYFTGFTKDFVVYTSFYPSPRLALVEYLPDTSKFAFMALLPKRRGKKFIDKVFNQINFSELFFNRFPAQVNIAMPEFKNEFSGEITDFCKELGIKTIFTEKADFSPMTKIPVYAKSFYHASLIAINHFEELQKTNSNTFTFSDNENLEDKELQEKEVILNRPFVYAVIHKTTGLPVFAGFLNQAPKTIKVEYKEIQETEREIDESLLSDVIDYTTDYNAFTKAILTKVADENKGNNFLLSPISLIMLLAIAAVSTEGSVQEEITNMISESLGFEKVLDMLDKFKWVLTSTSAFSMANGVCISHNHKEIIRLRFLYDIHTRLDGEIFADSDVQSAVNSWVKEKTHGLIDTLDIGSLSDTAALLMNGVAFKARWPEEFKEKDIKTKEFRNADGTINMVPMLHGQEKGFIKGDNYKGFVKFYKGSVYAFMALLPKEEGINTLKKTLKEIDIRAAFLKRTPCTVNFAVPEFKCEWENDLTTLCTQLGIKSIFSDEAGFTRVIKKKRLKVDSITHKAYIEIDRNGKKVVEVTAMETGSVCCSKPAEFTQEVILDRPFFYAIIHAKTGLPVLTGVLNKIKELTERDEIR